MPSALSAAASASRRPPATRIVYCAQTDVDPAGTVGTVTTSAKSFAIAARGSVARVDLVRKNLQLLAQDRGLDGIEPRGETDTHIVVFVAALAVHAQAAQRVGKSVVVGHHRAAVAVAAERLGREETGRRRVAEGAEPAVVVDRAESPARHRRESNRFSALAAAAIAAVVGRQAEQIDRNDRLRR